MSYPDAPVTRLETYLARLAGQDALIPDAPITRIEEYLAYMIGGGGGVPAPTAGAHNAIFRGKNLGLSYTSDQADAIDAGTFDDLFVGDYWEMPWGESETPVKFRIAGFDTFYYMGAKSAPFITHHAVIVPDDVLITTIMDTQNIRGYVDTELFTTILPQINTQLSELFTIVYHSTSEVTNVLDSGSPSEIGSRTVGADLMAQTQLFGSVVYNPNSFYGIIDKYAQFPLFVHDPMYIMANDTFWTQTSAGIGSGTMRYCVMLDIGRVSSALSTQNYGCRPYFLVGKAS